MSESGRNVILFMSSAEAIPAFHVTCYYDSCRDAALGSEAFPRQSCMGRARRNRGRRGAQGGETCCAAMSGGRSVRERLRLAVTIRE